MKVLTAVQMREVDRKTTESAIPGLVLMENAGHRVVEFLERRFAPLGAQRVVIFCGKGNNAGDGFVVARQLHMRLHPRSLHVVFAGDPEQLKGNAAANYQMLRYTGCPVFDSILPEMRAATLIVDAVLGTGLEGPPRGIAAEWIREINGGFPLARVVAVDIPSGVSSDAASSPGDCVRAHATVTFTAPKIGQVLAPNSACCGELVVAPIGSPPELYESDPSIQTHLNTPLRFARLLAPRPPASHKGDFGHVLVVGGSRGKTGAAAMAGLAALHAGAGLVTVASAASAIPVIASHAPELMTEAWPETPEGDISLRALLGGHLSRALEGKTIAAIGPGLGRHPETAALVRRFLQETPIPAVVDADGLNALTPGDFPLRPSVVLTPHPGEMARLCGRSSREVQAGRLAVARDFAVQRGVTLVLKGYQTLVAFPDGNVWVNPTGGPGMASGGMGDILTGLIAGLMAQFPGDAAGAVLAGVWLHGRCGDLGAEKWGEKPLLATGLLSCLPEALKSAPLPE